MPDDSPPNLVIRDGTPADYEAFSRLFPELATGDPIPGLEAWVQAFVESTLIAILADEVVGYCYFQTLADTGYVRHIVVSPAVRRKGVGRALMVAVATCLRSRGKRSWALNVKPDNRSAITLYELMGLSPRYGSKALELPWSALEELPAGDVLVREPSADRDGTLEELFGVPAGQLAVARHRPRIVLEAVTAAGERPIGVAVFDPKSPRAFPFRVKELAAVRPLLAAMRAHVPSDESVRLVIEDDPRLAGLLESVGATVRLEVLHMVGQL